MGKFQRSPAERGAHPMGLGFGRGWVEGSLQLILPFRTKRRHSQPKRMNCFRHD